MKAGTLHDLTGAKVDPVAAERPTWLDAALAADPVLDEAWRGLLKNVVECDRGVICALLRAGRTDLEILAALRWRPIRYHLPPEDESLVATMAKLSRVLRDERTRAARAVVVQGLVIYDGDPPTYRATVASASGPVEVVLTSQELMSPTHFRRRVLELCHWLPDVPRKQTEWDDLVRGWLAAASHVNVGETDRSFNLGEIEAIVRQWPTMEAADAHESDLRRGVIVRDDEVGIEIIHLAAVRRELRVDGLVVGPQDLAVQMRDLGWRAERPYVGGKRVRAWTRKLEPPS